MCNITFFRHKKTLISKVRDGVVFCKLFNETNLVSYIKQTKDMYFLKKLTTIFITNFGLLFKKEQILVNLKVNSKTYNDIE